MRICGLAAAILIQLLLLLALLRTETYHRDVPNSIELLLLPDNTTVEHPAPPKPVELTQPKPVEITLSQPVIRVAAVPETHPPQPENLPSPRQSTPAATTAISVPPAAPAVPASGAASDAFNAAIRAAVFAAYRVPASARALGESGETRIGFSLFDGAVRDIRIIASSGHDALDRAALAAARDATYPTTPEALRGRLLEFQIVLYNRRTN